MPHTCLMRVLRCPPMDLTRLNPCQRGVVTDLMGFGLPRPTYGPEFSRELVARLEDGLAVSAAEHTPDDPLVLSKSRLTEVLTCEGLYLSRDAQPFAMSRAMALGILTHKAVERLLVDLERHPNPHAATEYALARASSGEDALASWLTGLDEDERLEIKGEVRNLATEFVQQWPPLERGWYPRVENRASALLCGGRVKLYARYDLALGKPEGSEARTLIVDLKTRSFGTSHFEEIRFYALVETVRVGIPPFRVALHSLETGGHYAEDVTAATLSAACERVVEAAAALGELRRGRQPSLRPGPACNWCGSSGDCPPGRAWIEDDVTVIESHVSQASTSV